LSSSQIRDKEATVRTDPDFGGVIGRTWRESTPWWPETATAPPGAPNVVFVLLDDVGFADLGCYGSEIATPHIDQLAARGLRYTNFHTTAMCSPTRACLLTGRNAHSVGMGIIAEWSSGFPGYHGKVTKRAATIAEMLRDRGYNTFAVGKWHLMPVADATGAGPFDGWPLGRGFDRWYGFHGALADQWHPELFGDNGTLDAPQDSAYHLSEDLIDHAMTFVRDQQSVAPDKPFFLYVAFGACHWPHQAPAEAIARYRGRYDRGWDAVREERFARQKALGIVPAETELAPRNPGVRAWAELSADEQRLAARLQEAYAGFMEHTDAQIGRLVAFLERMGRLDDTLIVLLSDNGASPEGGPLGAVNGRKHLNYEPETLEDGLASLELVGSDRAYNHYGTGWAQVSNTPLKWYKKDTHAGGVRDPLVVHWPRRITERGAIRTQYHHVVDVVPTVLEALGMEPPRSYRGIDQMPVHGVSMLYSFDAAGEPTRRTSQYYELCGDRAVWHDGWKAVARHDKGTDFEADRWELYHLDQDFSECHDLAQKHPERLREMVERWWAEAGAFGVLPLDDREYERVAASVAARARRRYVYAPDMARIDRLSAPSLTDRSFSITAEVEIAAGTAGAATRTEGVILSSGSRFGGHVLYVKDGRLVYEYVYSQRVSHIVRSEVAVPAGRHTVRVQVVKTGERRGRATLMIDGRRVGSIDIPKTWPAHGLTAGLHCGRDGATPVSDAYTLPFAFTGVLDRVVVELDDDTVRDVAGECRSAMSEE
jgi:arylsulfatase